MRRNRARACVLGIIASLLGVAGCGSKDDKPSADNPKLRSTAHGSTARADDPDKRAPDKRALEKRAIDERQLAVLADSGQLLASQFTGTVRNPESLDDLRDAILARSARGFRVLQTKLEQFRRGGQGSPFDVCQVHYDLGRLSMYEGRFDDSVASFENVLRLSRSSSFPAWMQNELTALLGIIAMRRGEQENCIECLGPSSCIFPIAREAVHTNPSGSREAIKHFTAFLAEDPGDLRIRWLLNLAYMTVGEYPDKVPPEFLVPLDRFRSQIDVGKFRNVAPLVGLTSRGPNLAGGTVFDDLTGDGLPDLVTTSLDADRGASLYVNRGDGTFEDRSKAAGLSNQIYALNVTRADYDNDGDLDLLLLRGGWEVPMRMSLLRNNGHGVFEDVTLAAGLGELIASESAAWGDFDNDGLVDVFVCGEYQPPAGDKGQPDLRNRCRLYHNRGDGTFEDVAEAAGVTNEQWAKGCGWGDYDGDGWPDLFVSNKRGPCRLYHNEHNGTFRDVAPELGLKGPTESFACWFWDYDNDGRLDIYVNDYQTCLAEFVALALGKPIDRPSRPCLFRNLGAEGFRDVTQEVGLDLALMPMGCNFGDIDNDGYLDIYIGTGRMDLETLVPNLMLKNVEGRRFEDVTMSSGTGHLQKGHGVSFADWNCDGQLDLVCEAGGAVPGDKAYNLLFQNPGHAGHWLKVKLIGAQTNRAALGARIRATLKDADGKSHSIYRTIGNNSSFGGNSLVELIGLGQATSVAELEVSWPTSHTTQSFHDVTGDQAIEITEGAETFKPLKQPPLTVPTRKTGR